MFPSCLTQGPVPLQHHHGSPVESLPHRRLVEVIRVNGDLLVANGDWEEEERSEQDISVRSTSVNALHTFFLYAHILC